MTSKKMVKDWYQLNKDLVDETTISIDEKIRQAEVRLFNLKAKRERGIIEDSSKPQKTKIDGVLIRHLTKSKIALSVSRAKNRKRYDEQIVIVERWLKKNGYKWFKTCQTVNTEDSGCDGKTAKWWNKK